VRQGIAVLRQARIADYGNYEAAWKLARASYYLGEHTTDERERDAAIREGSEAGKLAVQLDAGKPEGHFWLGANYGGAAEHSTLAGLSTVEDIRREMEAVLKIDERYQNGSAYLALGQLYLEAPRLLGGDYQKAIEALEKGLKFGSDNALLRVSLAEAYHDVKRDADARKQIDVLLKMTPDPNYLPEHKEAVDKANALVEKMDRTGGR
jgi:tetratricopeptide (TPR) repeat protein